MTSTLSLPGLEPAARSSRRRGAVPAGPAERPGLLQRLVRERSAPVARRETAAAPASLDALVTSTWDGLAAGHEVACLACGESMAPRAGGGACHSCGTTLA